MVYNVPHALFHGGTIMTIWFEGSIEIECTMQQVKDAFDNLGKHYVGVIGFMPGLTSVELVDQGDDFVTIRTNEGLMKRTKFSKQIEAERVVVEFDEEYKAGSKITTKSHFIEEFITSDSGVQHRTELSGVESPGLLGFFYRNFGKSSIGNALLNSYKSYFEQ